MTHPEYALRPASAASFPALLPSLTACLAACLTVFFFLSCAVTGARQETAIPETTETTETADAAETGSFDLDRAFGGVEQDPSVPLRFVPAPLPGVRSVPGVGLITREQRDLGGALTEEERDRLSSGFRNAYTEGLLRDLPLEGVLGGDMVHGWPVDSPLTWVQNWRSGETRPNSWAAPSLVLAVQGLAHDRVFVVHGRVLDAYGKSAGRGGANGVSGYGAPRGGEFFYRGGLAQRFDYGLITVDAEGAAFVEEVPPSALAELPEAPGEAPEIRELFRSAWKTAVDRNFPPLPPDMDPVHVDFGSSPWTVTAGSRGGSEFVITLRGLWYQSCGGGRALFVLADAPGLPPYPRLLVSPWLEAFLDAPRRRLPGAESLDDASPPEYRSEENRNFVRTLLDSVAFYGVPLSDSLPLVSVPAGDEAAAAGYCEAQRFSKGWMRTD
jgi:hypothetical protein